MQSYIIFCFVALVACAHARVHYRPPPPGYVVGHPDADMYWSHSRPHHGHGRHARDTTWERSAAGGKFFGTLGSTDDSVYVSIAGCFGFVFSSLENNLLNGFFTNSQCNAEYTKCPKKI